MEGLKHCQSTDAGIKESDGSVVVRGRVCRQVANSHLSGCAHLATCAAIERSRNAGSKKTPKSDRTRESVNNTFHLPKIRAADARLRKTHPRKSVNFLVGSLMRFSRQDPTLEVSFSPATQGYERRFSRSNTNPRKRFEPSKTALWASCWSKRAGLKVKLAQVSCSRKYATT